MERIRRTKAEQLRDVGAFVSARKVDHNTVERTLADGTRIIRLHLTDIVTIAKSGAVSLNSGGYKTHTTKDRITGYLPVGFSLWTNKGIWYLGRRSDGAKFTFADGITILPSGKVKGVPRNEDTRLEQINRKIAAYCKALRALPELPKPDNGDCWYCLMTTADGKPWGEVEKSSDHIEAHLDEKYFVGSLILRALRWAGWTDTAIGWAFNDKYPADRVRVVRTVRRYIRMQLGLGA